MKSFINHVSKSKIAESKENHPKMSSFASTSFLFRYHYISFLINKQWFLLGLILAAFNFASNHASAAFISTSRVPVTTNSIKRKGLDRVVTSDSPSKHDAILQFTRPLKITDTILSTSTVLLAKKKKTSSDDLNKTRGEDNETDDENDDKKKRRRMKNWVRRIGDRFKTGNEINDDDDDNNNSNNTREGKEEENVENKKEKTGILGSIGKVFKRFSPEEFVEIDIEEFDPSFNSEIALAIEIKRQKALDNYVLGDEIPDIFLPKELLESKTSSADNKKMSIDLNKVVSSLDESISYMEKQIQLFRIEQSKYTAEVIPNVIPEGEKRLMRLKRDLETTRKNIILDDQKKRKVATLEARAAQEKAREKARVEALRAKEMNKRTNNQKVSSNDEADLETSFPGNIRDRVAGVGKNVSNAIEGMKGGAAQSAIGVMNGASSALTNVWKTVRNDDNDEWTTVCPKTRISPGEVFPVVAGGVDLLVIGSKDGTKIHCIANNCPHLGTPLESGMIERRKRESSDAPSYSMSTEDDTKPMINDGFEDCIVCPLHQTAFSLDTGEVNGEWCPYPPVLGKVMGTVKQKNRLPTFNMRTKGKNIQIKISSMVELDDDESEK